MNPLFKTVLLLACSNTFMTIAWYWHLKFEKFPLWLVIPISWAIAGVEYCFAVPANRIGAEGGLSGAKLKIIQEAITLTVFVGFALVYLREPLHWKYFVGFGLVMAGVCVVFAKW